jgi:hypothetical protein
MAGDARSLVDVLRLGLSKKGFAIMSSPKRRLAVLHQKGAVRFMLCPRCNSRIESRLFHSVDAEEEIQNLYRDHPCKIAAIPREVPERPDFHPKG